MKTLYWTCAILAVALLGETLAQDAPQLDIEKYELANGLDVVFYENHSLPKVSVHVVYDVGSKDEEVGRTGFAHLFEHMMFQGSENHDREYFEPLNKVGAYVNGGTSEDWTMYLQDVPSEHLELVLWLESDRMGFLLPAMTQEKLDNQRDVVKNERRQSYENRPYAKSSLILADLMYPKNHPYSWPVIGSQQDLTAASLEDVSDFFRNYYTPNNATLVVGGDFDPAVARELIDQYFASIPPGPAVDRMREWVPTLDGERRAVAEDDVDLSRLYYVWHTPGLAAPGDAEFDLLSSILTGGKTSRLFKSLVYDRQIAQNVSARQSSRALSSEYEITVTAREGHSLAEIAAVLDEELALLLSEGVSQEELDLVIVSWEATFIRGLEHIGGFYGIAGRLGLYNTAQGDPNGFAGDLARYRSATVESINATVRQFLQPDRRAVLEIVPRGSLSVAEATVDRSQTPASGTETTFEPPSIHRSQLSNGLEVLVVEDHALPLVQANLVIKNGWTADDAATPGAITLVAAMLDEGTKKRSALEISDEARAIAANLATGSSFDGSFIRMNVLKKSLNAGLGLMADVALNPVFSAEELERQREHYLGQMQQFELDPSARSRRALMTAIFGEDHPYGRLMWQPVRGGALYYGHGTAASVSDLSRDDLVSTYETYYRPNNAALVFVGDISIEEASKQAKRHFGKWKSADVPAEPELQATPAEGVQILLVDKPNAPQSVIVAGNLGMRYSDTDLPAFQMVREILGGSFQRLDLNLREDKGYTYGVGFSLWDDRARGPMYVITNVQTPSTSESITEIVKELREIVTDRPPTAQELSDARASLVKTYPSSFESVGAIAAGLETVVLQGLGDDAWVASLASWEAVSQEQLIDAARQHLSPDDLVIVVVGDLATIAAPIRALGLGTVSVVGE
ncbi:MAG: insulinase family protein [Gemmatimonadetes bacterium]|nr:insulinase family protein [Gemmatimonadota bacterium]